MPKPSSQRKKRREKSQRRVENQAAVADPEARPQLPPAQTLPQEFPQMASMPSTITDGNDGNHDSSYIPQAYQQYRQNLSESRTSSTGSMDEYSSITNESILEYSDTSDDYYFQNAESRMEHRTKRPTTGESSFRKLRDGSSKSSRVIRFGAASSQPTDSPGSEDNDGDLSMPSTPRRSQSDDLLRSWMSNIAYSFRSPAPQEERQGTGLSGMTGNQAAKNARKSHRSQFSSATMEYPYRLSPRGRHAANPEAGNSNVWETSPLLALPSLVTPGSVYGGPPDANQQQQQPAYNAFSNLHPSQQKGMLNNQERAMQPLNEGPFENEPQNGKQQTGGISHGKATTIAAYFLKDYEAGRPPTLSPQFDSITSSQLQLYRIRMSWVWRWLILSTATFLLFYAHTQDRLFSAWIHTWAIFIFVADIRMRDEIRGTDSVHAREQSDEHLIRPMVLFLVLLGLESWFWYFVSPNDPFPHLITSLFKPLVFFYISSKARDAFEAVWRIVGIVTRVLLIEIFLILTFAAVACRMFHGFASFENLSRSWLSLFELSTTVVNPALWMPMYHASRTSAIFFVIFIIIATFYLHSLVLSVVFQTYIQAASEIHERPAADREDAISLSFAALASTESASKDSRGVVVNVISVRKTLQIVRPHYSSPKVKALVDIIDPNHLDYVDYVTFRTKIRQALNASIRTSRSTTTFSMVIELVAIIVAALNFIYVVLLTSEFEADWFNEIVLSAGSIITLLGLMELTVRFNPFRFSNFAPITRLNATFDGLALLAAMVSLYGIGLFSAQEYSKAVDYILLGRAIDMIRVMRFFPIFRDVVRRSSDVFPALAGPLYLVLTSVHIFVYFGMTLWGGAINTELLSKNENLTPLYYLNNFNSYTEGLVTVFNILVVNDWHAIAEVYLYADRCSSPLIVYPYFVLGNLVAVCIMLNLITAFFVGSFVTKLDEIRPEEGETGMKPSPSDRDFRIQSSERPVTKIQSTARFSSLHNGPDNTIDPKDYSPRNSSQNDIVTFDVYEREGYDRIMKTVAGSAEDTEALASSICDYLEVFESLTPGREKIGYMVCCQQTKTRFGNRRFQTISKDFVDEEILYQVVSDMHSELLALTSSEVFEDRCLIRTFRHKVDQYLRLEISASLVRNNPAVSLLVLRTRQSTKTATATSNTNLETHHGE